jgi:hypothetical protein
MRSLVISDTDSLQLWRSLMHMVGLNGIDAGESECWGTGS